MKKIIELFILVVTIMLSENVYGQDGAIDPTFNPTDVGYGYGDGANAFVRTAIIQSDGKIIIGGDFITYNGTSRNHIARTNVDGTLDVSFNPGTGTNGPIFAIAVQSDGKIIIGGDFTSYNGTARNRIARLNVDGTLDGTFNVGTGTTNNVYSISVQSDGKIIVGGWFASYNGVTNNNIVRLNIDGTIDATFNTGTGTNNMVYSTAVQNDGKIILMGDFTFFNGKSKNRIVRLNTDGSIDSTYIIGAGASHAINASALQSDGKIIIAGNFTYYNNTSLYRVARLNTNGTLDATFSTGTGANGDINSIAIQNDGKVIIVGQFVSYKGKRDYIARLNSNGTFDATLNTGTGPNTLLKTVAIQSDGKIIVGGFFISFNGIPEKYAARLNADGTVDSTFNEGTGADNIVETVAIQSDGKIIIGGFFNSFNGTAINRAARLEPDGTLDGTFNVGKGFDNTVQAIAIQSDGKVIVGGDFTSFNGITMNHIVRLNSNGTRDATFTVGIGFDNDVHEIDIQSDGKIITVGDFNYYNGVTMNYIGRLNADGTKDAAFNPGAGANGPIYSSAIQNDGKIVIGGAFTAYNGTPTNYIARLNADGSLDGTFNMGAGTNNGVTSVVLQSDGKIIVGGQFSSYNGVSRNFIARLNIDGSLDGTFDVGAGTNSTVYSTAVQNDGKIIVVGQFTSYNGTAHKRITRLNIDATVDMTFNVGTGTDNAIKTVVIQNDGKIIIGGFLTSYNNSGRNRVARILTGTATAMKQYPMSDESVKVFSNLLTSNCIISFNKEMQNASIQMIDALGRQIKNAKFSGKELVIEKGELPPGIYFLQVISENEMIANEKIVIQ